VIKVSDRIGKKRDGTCGKTEDPHCQGRACHNPEEEKTTSSNIGCDSVGSKEITTV
jgi:hypothetical protein